MDEIETLIPTFSLSKGRRGRFLALASGERLGEGGRLAWAQKTKFLLRCNKSNP